MQLRHTKVAAAALAGLMALLCGTALASSLSFAWTMNNRYVNGKTNGRFHTLDAGELTLSGKIWITEKRAAAASTPLSISMSVVKEQDSSERDAVCTVTVTPDTTINNKKEFSRSCGRIESGKFWLLIDKVGASNPDGDGWHNQGSGTLTTN